MKLTEICVKNPVLAWMIMGATIVFGLIAAQRIGISQFPDVDHPTVSVTVNWENAAPEAVEQDVVEILEEALVQVEGVQTITSSAQQGRGRITLEFKIERDIDLAMQEVQSVISQAQSDLPSDIDPPVVRKTNPEDRPIMYIAISGPFSRQMLADTVRYRLMERIQTIEGVGEVTLGGYLERNVRIWIDADALEEYNLTIRDVTSALQREHVELPAGRMETAGREVNVRVMGEAVDLEELRNIVVWEGDGQAIHIHQVALVEDGFEDERRLSRVDGVPAQGIGVRKQRGANAVEVAQTIRAELDVIREGLPDGMELGINYDSTKFVEEAVAEIQFELILAVILTALICWMFLGSISSTLNVVLAIPMSLLGTIAVIYFLGFTLNTFTLLALALAVGIVVDDAIMIMENIFRHHEEGADRDEAAIGGTTQIAFAALAATIAIIAIFVPVVFMEGVIGRFFLQFGVTLSLAVLFSYLEAVTLAPARLAKMLGEKGRPKRRGLGLVVDRAFDGLKGGYGKILRPALRYPAFVLIVAGGFFAGALWLMVAMPKEFVPSQDQSRLMVSLETAIGSNFDETDQLFQKAEKVVNDHPNVQRAFAIVGGWGGSDVNVGRMFVTLVPPGDRELTQNQVGAELSEGINAIPGVRARVRDLSQSGFGAGRGYPVEFSVRGPDFEKLGEIADDLATKLEESGYARDVDTDYLIGMPELRIIPDRAKAADLGVPMEDVAVALNALVGGTRVGKFSDAGRRLDVRVRLLKDQRNTQNDIERLKVRSESGQLIPLSHIVETEELPVLQSINRQDRERSVSIMGNPGEGVTQEEALEMGRELGSDLPEGYHVVMSGAAAEYNRAVTSLVFAMLMGILVAYMVLAAQFNSFFHPVTVLTIVPISIAGAALALFSTDQTLNVFSMIGLLLLIGIAKKNSIILVDYANQLRVKGLTAREAMQEAGPIRLRPILMTASATMMAALPAAMALGPGGEIRRPMAVGVLGGMFVATALSLLVVPSFYVLLDDALGFFRRRKQRRRQDNETADSRAES